jgi:alcohol dehydrogenase
MKALVYKGPGEKAWEDVPDPKVEQPTDVIVRMVATTICGTDLHLLTGDAPRLTSAASWGTRGSVRSPRWARASPNWPSATG